MNIPQPGGKPESGQCGAEISSEPSVDAGIQGKLGRKLRETYQAVVNEELPDKFHTLLEQLKNSPRGVREEGS